jgi:hypothetical protein
LQQELYSGAKAFRWQYIKGCVWFWKQWCVKAFSNDKHSSCIYMLVLMEVCIFIEHNVHVQVCWDTVLCQWTSSSWCSKGS